jgi:hypothetical protein
MTKSWGEKETKRGRGQRATEEQVPPEVQVPVFYNGCVVYTKTPHNCGTSFSLEITHPHSSKSIKVDSSVILRKRFENTKKWGMVVRFISLTEGEKDKIYKILSQAAAIPESASESKYLNTPIGQAILRYFNLKRLFD